MKGLATTAAVLLACAAGGIGGGVGDFPAAALSFNVTPTGNGFPTKSTLSVQGATNQSHTREFLVDFGLVSDNGGLAASSPFRDKVALYVATEARPGTGDVWAINPLVTQMPGSGEYAAQGIELDFNNNNAHRGDADGGAGLAFPVSYGLSITGAGSFRSTAALLVCGEVGMWNRGIVFANNAVNQSTFQDLGSPHTSVDIRGSPTYGVYQTSPTAKNVFAGGTAVAADDPAGYQLRVGGAASAHSRWTDADATAVAGVAVDAVLSGDVLGMLAKLEPKRWRRRNGTGAIGDAGMGFLAQDVEQAVPAELAKALVRTGGDGRKSISYERLAAVAIAGLRQSARKVDSLEQRVQVAENDRNKMARRVARLEQQMDLFLTFF